MEKDAGWAVSEVRAQAERQLAEHKEHLKLLYQRARERLALEVKDLSKSGLLVAPPEVTYLDIVKSFFDNWVDGIALDLVKLEEPATEGAKASVTVVYSYPDELVRFLQSEECPAEIRDACAGGTEVTP